MNNITDKQLKYLQTILEWLYATPIAYDEISVLEIPDICSWDYVPTKDENLPPTKYSYKISTLKYVLEVTLNEKEYNDYTAEYLNTLKPLYKHIKKVTNAKLDT